MFFEKPRVKQKTLRERERERERERSTRALKRLLELSNYVIASFEKWVVLTGARMACT